MTGPAKKKNCLWCPYFRPRSWVLGWCDKKEHYIYKHIRFCGPGFHTKYSMEEPDRILEHWIRAEEWATIRAALALEYFESLTEEAQASE